MPKKKKRTQIIGNHTGKRATIKFKLENVAEAAGVSYNTVRAASKRRLFDRKDLRSIAHYIVATYIKIKLKEGGYYE